MHELSNAYRGLGRIELRKAPGRARSPKLKIWRVHIPGNGYDRHLVADIAYNLASLAYHERGRGDLARPLLQKALAVEEELFLSFPTVGEYGFYLGSMLRDFRDWFGDTSRLEAYRKRLTTAISRAEGEPRPAEQKPNADPLKYYYSHRSGVDLLLGRYTDFIEDLRGATANGGINLIPRMTEAFQLAQRGEYIRAESAAAALAASDSGNGERLYLAAQTSAIFIGLAGNDRSIAPALKKELSERSGARAVAWLSEARTCKYFSTPTTRWLLLDDRSLDSLRQRADFRALIATGNSGTSQAK